MIAKDISSSSEAFLEEEVLITWKISKSVTRDHDFNIYIRSNWKVACASDDFEYIALRNVLYLVTKSVASMSSDVYKDNIFSTKYSLVYLKAWNISFLSASTRKIV